MAKEDEEWTWKDAEIRDLCAEVERARAERDQARAEVERLAALYAAATATIERHLVLRDLMVGLAHGDGDAARRLGGEWGLREAELRCLARSLRTLGQADCASINEEATTSTSNMSYVVLRDERDKLLGLLERVLELSSPCPPTATGSITAARRFHEWPKLIHDIDEAIHPKEATKP